MSVKFSVFGLNSGLVVLISKKLGAHAQLQILVLEGTGDCFLRAGVISELSISLILESVFIMLTGLPHFLTEQTQNLLTSSC